MKRSFHVLLILSTVFVMISCKQQVAEVPPLKYPVTQKGDTVDVYFGQSIADPYRWLEDDRSAETEAWVKAQNEVTFGYLETIPYRAKIKSRLEKLWNYPKYNTPWKQGNKYFFYKNDGMQNQSVLYVKDSIDGEAKVLLDPNKLAEDGTKALSNTSISNDGKYLAYGVSSSGSDWVEFFVMNIETGEKLSDHVQWAKFSGASWKGEGFYYSAYDAPKEGSEFSNKNEFHKVYYHKLGTPQSADVLIHKNDAFPQRNYYAYTTEDEKYLFLSESQSTDGNALYMKEANAKTNFVKIADGFDFEYNVIDNIDNKIFMITNDGAPKYRLVVFDAKKPAKENWVNIIPEQEDVLNGVSLIGGKLVATYMKDAYDRAYVYDLEGKMLNEITLPGIGSLGGFTGIKNDSIAFYSFSSFIFPSTIYKYNIASNQSEVYIKPDIDFDVDSYETKQVFYTSKDGTKIPMFITHKKGIALNGQNPTMLYGYGGFNISLTPTFSTSRLILLENGGIYAQPNLRGGGEYGEEWHQAGTQLKKQNVFDDFIAAAEYLIENKYTTAEKLAINGGSNGGLLIGAVMLQRPELFAVAIPEVGVLDMLRYHKFTIGWAWAGDYGTSDDETQFKNLIKYSPVHNVKPNVQYPATLITTGDHDDRVVPAHSFKFAATLQENYKGNKPMLIRIETKAGHGAGKPTAKIIEERSDVWSFMFYNMGITPSYK